ncbi:hypothetical protein [Endozoicomonas ascidiicola]|uniref:hypothetical protein n=1 Tax=Endozoicomonas ascidiicola TaxID=1698521 RepID=UPI0008295136|nr:hypothetical protein [Endozoicomonas ascidiicola]
MSKKSAKEILTETVNNLEGIQEQLKVIKEMSVGEVMKQEGDETAYALVEIKMAKKFLDTIISDWNGD